MLTVLVYSISRGTFRKFVFFCFCFCVCFFNTQRTVQKNAYLLGYKRSLQIFGVIPFVKLQNYDEKRWKIRWCTYIVFLSSAWVHFVFVFCLFVCLFLFYLFLLFKVSKGKLKPKAWWDDSVCNRFPTPVHTLVYICHYQAAALRLREFQ